MGMLFARRRKPSVDTITTTKNLLGIEQKKVENVQAKKAKSVPTNTQNGSVANATQPKFKI